MLRKELAKIGNDVGECAYDVPRKPATEMKERLLQLSQEIVDLLVQLNDEEKEMLR